MHMRRFASKNLGAKAITASYPAKTGAWARRVNVTGFAAVTHRAGIAVGRNLVFLQLVNILNTVFKYWAGSCHLSLTRSMCWRKAVQSLIRYFWTFNAQLHVHLKKWTSKFKLLYPLNHISCFDDIGRICCVNTRIRF